MFPKVVRAEQQSPKLSSLPEESPSAYSYLYNSLLASFSSYDETQSDRFSLDRPRSSARSMSFSGVFGPPRPQEALGSTSTPMSFPLQNSAAESLKSLRGRAIPGLSLLDSTLTVEVPAEWFSPNYRWRDDAEVEVCAQCKQSFSTISRRRHHCRRCGDIFCDNCSSKRIRLGRLRPSLESNAHDVDLRRYWSIRRWPESRTPEDLLKPGGDVFAQHATDKASPPALPSFCEWGPEVPSVRVCDACSRPDVLWLSRPRTAGSSVQICGWNLGSRADELLVTLPFYDSPTGLDMTLPARVSVDGTQLDVTVPPGVGDALEMDIHVSPAAAAAAAAPREDAWQYNLKSLVHAVTPAASAIQEAGHVYTAAFAYQAPSVESVSRPATAGGLLRITGRNFGPPYAAVDPERRPRVMVKIREVWLEARASPRANTVDVEAPPGVGGEHHMLLYINGLTCRSCFSYAAPEVHTATMAVHMEALRPLKRTESLRPGLEMRRQHLVTKLLGQGEEPTLPRLRHNDGPDQETTPVPLLEVSLHGVNLGDKADAYRLGFVSAALLENRSNGKLVSCSSVVDEEPHSKLRCIFSPTLDFFQDTQASGDQSGRGVGSFEVHLCVGGQWAAPCRISFVNHALQPELAHALNLGFATTVDIDEMDAATASAPGERFGTAKPAIPRKPYPPARVDAEKSGATTRWAERRLLCASVQLLIAERTAEECEGFLEAMVLTWLSCAPAIQRTAEENDTWVTETSRLSVLLRLAREIMAMDTAGNTMPKVQDPDEPQSLHEMVFQLICETCSAIRYHQRQACFASKLASDAKRVFGTDSAVIRTVEEAARRHVDELSKPDTLLGLHASLHESLRPSLERSFSHSTEEVTGTTAGSSTPSSNGEEPGIDSLSVESHRLVERCRSKLLHIRRLKHRDRLVISVKLEDIVPMLLEEAQHWSKTELLMPLEAKILSSSDTASCVSGASVLSFFLGKLLSGSGGFFSRPSFLGLALPTEAVQDVLSNYEAIGVLLLKGLLEGARLPPVLHPLLTRFLLLAEAPDAIASKRLPRVSLDDVRLYDPSKTLDLIQAAKGGLEGDPYAFEGGYEERLESVCWEYLVGERLNGLNAIRKGFTGTVEAQSVVSRIVSGAAAESLVGTHRPSNTGLRAP
eukprot:scaffold1247_cov251-Pinguiococcus_pyrenoidosus.AAC.20